MLCLPLSLPVVLFTRIFLQVAHPGSLRARICLPWCPQRLEQCSEHSGFPGNICFPPTTYLALGDVQPLGRLWIFGWFSISLALLNVPDSSVPLALLRSLSWGNWSFFLCPVCLSVWGHLLSSLLSREPGDPLTVFYISSRLWLTVRTFSSPSLGDQQVKVKQGVWLTSVFTLASVGAGQPCRLLFKGELGPPSSKFK